MLALPPRGWGCLKRKRMTARARYGTQGTHELHGDMEAEESSIEEFVELFADDALRKHTLSGLRDSWM